VEGANHNDVAFVGGTRYSDALKAFAILIQRHLSKVCGKDSDHFGVLNNGATP